MSDNTIIKIHVFNLSRNFSVAPRISYSIGKLDRMDFPEFGKGSSFFDIVCNYMLSVRRVSSSSM